MQMTESAAAKHHFGPIKTQISKTYVTTRLSNEIVANEVVNTGSVKPIPVFIPAINTRDLSI